MQCPHCGRQVSDGARFCSSCGQQITSAAGMVQPQPNPQPSPQPQPQPTQRPAAQQPPAQPAPQQVPVRAPQPQPVAQQIQPTVNAGGGNKTLATVSLVCGILGIVFAILLSGWSVIFTILALALGIGGIVCAVKAKKQGVVGGVRTAGFVCSILAVIVAVLSLLALLAIILFFQSLSSAL